MRIRSGLKLAMAFFRRDLVNTASYRFALLLTVAGIVAYLAVFYFIAQLIGESGVSLDRLANEHPVAGAAMAVEELSSGYFPFVLIGLAFYGYLGTALGSFAGTIRQGQVQGTLEAMLATRTSLTAILVCSSLWRFCYTSLEVLAYLAVGSLLFGVKLGTMNLPATLVVLVMTILAFIGFGILSAAFVLVFKRGDPVAYALGSASALLGGVYFPVAVLPSWLQSIASWLPITHALRAARRTILEGSGLGAVSHELAMLVLFTALLLPMSLLAMKLALRRAKVDGSLAHY